MFGPFTRTASSNLASIIFGVAAAAVLGLVVLGDVVLGVVGLGVVVLGVVGLGVVVLGDAGLGVVVLGETGCTVVSWEMLGGDGVARAHEIIVLWIFSHGNRKKAMRHPMTQKAASIFWGLKSRV